MTTTSQQPISQTRIRQPNATLILTFDNGGGLLSIMPHDDPNRSQTIGLGPDDLRRLRDLIEDGLADAIRAESDTQIGKPGARPYRAAAVRDPDTIREDVDADHLGRTSEAGI